MQRHEPRLRDLVEAALPVAREVGCARHDVDIPDAVAWHGEGVGRGEGAWHGTSHLVSV